MKREHISTGTRWEPLVGYSRAVKAGNLVFVSGCTATDEEGNLVGGDNAYEQACQALHNIDQALHRAGAKRTDVVRTRIFVTDISRWQDIGQAHGEYFAHVRPATSMVQVAALIDPAMLVEIEADAVIDA